MGTNDGQKHTYFFRTGFSQLGSVLAFLLSWAINHCWIWGFVHMCLGWVYICYWLVNYGNIEEVVKKWLLK